VPAFEFGTSHAGTDPLDNKGCAPVRRWPR
jgi:hypothetical protein